MNRNCLIVHTFTPERAIDDLKEIYHQKNESGKTQRAVLKFDTAKKMIPKP